MKKGVIALIVVGSVFTVTGAILLGIGISNEVKVSKTVTHTYDFEEAVNNFKLDTDTAEIRFVATDDDYVTVVCEETEKQYNVVENNNGTLSITSKDDLKWYERVFYYTGKKKVTINLPSGEYGDLVINSHTGDLYVNKEFIFDNVDIKLSTGDIYLYSSSINDVKVETSTGDINLDGVKAQNANIRATTGNVNFANTLIDGDIEVYTTTGHISFKEVEAINLTAKSSTGKHKYENCLFIENMNLKASTGDITIVDSDCESGEIETSTGDVNAVFLTNKNVSVQTNTGDVRIPSSKDGGALNIKTSTGDIIVSIK